MAWKETYVMDERMKFVAEWLSEELSFAELCRQHGVSRKTGYKFIGRYKSEGPSGLEDRSRAPHHHPNEVDAYREAAILALRKKRPTWGAKKLKDRLEKDHWHLQWPALSTIAVWCGGESCAVVVRRIFRRCRAQRRRTRSGESTSRVGSEPGTENGAIPLR